MLFIPIPTDIQMVVKQESSLTGKSVRQIIMDKLRKETTEKVYSTELVSNLNKLDEIKNLPKNWNGNGAGRIQKKLIKKSKSLLINLDKQPQIFPTANNCIPRSKKDIGALKKGQAAVKRGQLKNCQI